MLTSDQKTDHIIAVFEQFTKLSQPSKDWLRTHLRFMICTKGKFLFEAGKIPDCIYFLFSGLVHYYVEQDGATAEMDRQVCSWFLMEGDIVIPVVAFYNRQKTLENIQVTEDADVAFLSYEELVYFYTHFPETNIARAALTEAYRVRERSWHIRLATCSAEDNYLYLQQTAGNLIKRIKTNRMLASYLNISTRWVIKLKRKFGDD
jgi:hypothetical protein